MHNPIFTIFISLYILAKGRGGVLVQLNSYFNNSLCNTNITLALSSVNQYYVSNDSINICSNITIQPTSNQPPIIIKFLSVQFTILVNSSLSLVNCQISFDYITTPFTKSCVFLLLENSCFFLKVMENYKYY